MAKGKENQTTDKCVIHAYVSPCTKGRMIRLPEQEYKEAKKLAAASNRSISAIVGTLIRFALDRAELVYDCEDCDDFEADDGEV